MPLEERTLPTGIGGLDPAFGPGGTVRTNLGVQLTAEVAAGVAAQLDDRLVVVATYEDRAIAVVRYNANGTRDLAFGAQGVTLLDFGAIGVAAGVAIDTQGRIVVAGSRLQDGRHEFAVARLTTGGGLDATFGVAGTRTVGFGGTLDDARAVAIDGQGRIVVAGSTLQGATGFDVAVARLTAVGALDEAFGTGGRRVVHLGGGQDAAHAVAIDGQNRPIVAGSTNRDAATGVDMAVLRLTEAGVPDAAFGSGGIRTLALGTGDDVAQAVALDGRGRVVVAGWTAGAATQGDNFAVVRLSDAGVPDATFGAGGTRWLDLGGTADRARAVAVDRNDRIIAAGQTNSTGTGSDLAVVRLTEAGTYDGAFDDDGRTTVDLGTPNDVGVALATVRGRVVVAGAAGTPTDVVLACLVTTSPPVAAIKVGPGRVVEGETLTLDGSVSRAGEAGATLRYAWDLDFDGQFDDATGPLGTLSAATFDGRPAAYLMVGLRVTDPHGQTADTFAAIPVDNRAPALTAATPGVTVPAGTVATQRGTWGDVPADATSVRLTATLGAVTKADDGTWSWSLATASLPAATTVTITATDDDGGRSSTSFTLTTTPVGSPTIAGVTADGPALEGAPVTIAVAASHPGGDVLTYAFDWDRDGTYEVSGPAARASHAFADDGTYTVGVRVTDGQGASAFGSVAIAVANVAPTGTLVLPPGAAPVEGGSLVARLENVVEPGADTPRYSFALSRAALAGRYEDATTNPTASLPIANDGPVTVWACVFDEDGGMSESSRTVTAANVAPTPTIVVLTANPVEGAAVALSGAAADPGAGDVVTLSWRVSRGGAPFGPTGTGPAFTFTPDENGTYVVTLTATDDAGASREATRSLAVANVAPVIDEVIVLDPAREGATVRVLAPASDPAGPNDPLSYAFDWEGDGTFDPAGSTPQASHVFADDGTYTVRVRVTDDDGGETLGAVTVVVANVAPAGTLTLSPQVLMEGGVLTARLLGVVDPGADTLRYSFALSREGLARGYAEASPSNSAIFQPANDGTLIVWSRVFDEDGGGSELSQAIKVWNAPPVVAPPAVPAAPTRVRTAMTATATFTDAGRLDYHDALWEWGDGTTSPATIVEAGGSGRATGSHVYLIPGLYRVRLTVRDREGSMAAASATATTAVYDPTAGALGGSGSFASPAGALAANRTLTGTATYRLDVRYAGSTATTPTGSVTFALAAARLNFQSTRLEWLAIAGSRARVRGEGTINGTGRYGVAVTANDGSTRDAIRVRIWNKATGAIIYDNLPLADELSGAARPVSTGGVTITLAVPAPRRPAVARR